MKTGIRGVRDRFPVLIALPFCPLLLCCTLFSDGSDPCDKTIAPRIAVEVTYAFQITGFTPEQEVVPVNGCVLHISMCKKLCEGGEKGRMNISTNPLLGNTYQQKVGYNLHNREDAIYMEVLSECSNPDFEASVSRDNITTYSEAEWADGNVYEPIFLFH